MKPYLISLIVTTYNRPDALLRVLQALVAQDTASAFEVIIADDGSGAETAQLIKSLQPTMPYPLRHCWQEDQGFRAAKCRNRAVAAAQGEYLVFLDGDCIPFPDFIERHVQLAEYGWFVAGNRVLLSQQQTEQCLKQTHLPTEWTRLQWLQARREGGVNRLMPLLRLPLFNPMRKLTAQRWQGAKTCNLAVWSSDFIAINGFDENYQGWGHEDADLVTRLIHAGVFRKNGHFAVPVLHLWHDSQDRTSAQDNFARLQQRQQNLHFRAERGVLQYLNNLPEPPH